MDAIYRHRLGLGYIGKTNPTLEKGLELAGYSTKYFQPSVSARDPTILIKGWRNIQRAWLHRHIRQSSSPLSPIAGFHNHHFFSSYSKRNFQKIKVGGMGRLLVAEQKVPRLRWTLVCINSAHKWVWKNFSAF